MSHLLKSTATSPHQLLETITTAQNGYYGHVIMLICSSRISSISQVFLKCFSSAFLKCI